MRIFLIVLTLSVSFSIHAKEWKNLKQYQKSTKNKELSSSDWLTSDRTKNTLVWQQANVYNLFNNKPQEYQTIRERRDFYIWIDLEFEKKGHEVIWPKMALYITCKLRSLETFPKRILISKRVIEHSFEGSLVVFENAFERLKNLYNNNKSLKKADAFKWDHAMLKDEQYVWVENVYNKIDQKSLKQIEHVIRGDFLYTFVIPKAIRFKDDISNPEDRYQYAINVFRPYCINHYK